MNVSDVLGDLVNETSANLPTFALTAQGQCHSEPTLDKSAEPLCGAGTEQADGPWNF